MTQGKTASSVNELISCLRQWRDSTPDAWVLHTADVLERFQKALNAQMTHSRTLNSLLGKVEAENARLRKVVNGYRIAFGDSPLFQSLYHGDMGEPTNVPDATDDKN